MNNLAVDSQNVYFTTTTTVKSVPIGSDGGAAMLLTTEPDMPFPIAVGPAGLYWGQGYMGDSNNNGSLLTCDPPNCAATRTLLTFNQPGINSIGLMANSVVWSGPGNPASQGFVRTCPLGSCDGGPTTLLYPDQNLEALQVDTSQFYFVDYDIPHNRYNERYCPLAGCPADGGILLSTTPNVFEVLVVQGADAYWLDPSHNLVTCPVTGCAAATVIANLASYSASAFAVDATSIYFSGTDGTTAAVYRIPK